MVQLKRSFIKMNGNHGQGPSDFLSQGMEDEQHSTPQESEPQGMPSSSGMTSSSIPQPPSPFPVPNDWLFESPLFLSPSPPLDSSSPFFSFLFSPNSPLNNSQLGINTLENSVNSINTNPSFTPVSPIRNSSGSGLIPVPSSNGEEGSTPPLNFPPSQPEVASLDQQEQQQLVVVPQLTKKPKKRVIRKNQPMSKEAKTAILLWLANHRLHPYPSEREKQAFEKLGATRGQINNLCANERQRTYRMQYTPIRPCYYRIHQWKLEFMAFLQRDFAK